MLKENLKKMNRQFGKLHQAFPPNFIWQIIWYLFDYYCILFCMCVHIRIQSIQNIGSFIVKMIKLTSLVKKRDKKNSNKQPKDNNLRIYAVFRYK